MADYVVGSPALFNEDAKFFKDVYIYGKLYYDFESFPGIIRFGNITASQYIVSNGSSVQFLKADGTLDSTTYLTAASVGGISSNVPNTIIQRNGLGGFSAGIVTATSFSGSGSLSVSGTVSGSNITTGGNVTGSSASCTGNAATATTATNLSGGSLTNYAETINAVGNTGAAATINLANGNFVTATLTGNCTWTFTTGVTSGAVSFTLFLANDATASRTIVWPASVVWPGGTVPNRTTAASKTDVYTFFTINNGTTWYGNLAQYNY